MVGPPRDVQLGLDALITGIGGERRACQVLKVSPRTLRRWRSTCPPYQAAALLWWSGNWAELELTADARRRVDMALWRAEAAERQVRELRAELARVMALLRAVDQAANDASRA